MKNEDSGLLKGIYKLRVGFLSCLGFRAVISFQAQIMWSVLMANKVVHEAELVLLEMTGLFINVAQDKLLVIL